MDFKDFLKAIAHIYPAFLILGSIIVSLGAYIWKNKLREIDGKLKGLESSINYESKFRNQIDFKIETSIGILFAKNADNEKDISKLAEKIRGVIKVCEVKHKNG